MQILLELPYWPPVSWLTRAWHCETLWLEACENFQKNSYRNRCHIAGPNGIQRLSVPLEKGKHQHTPIRDVRIAYQEPWQKQHWKSIATAYGNAPYYEYLADAIGPFYQKQYRFLFDFNLGILEFVFEKIAWSGTIRQTAEFGMTIENGVFDHRNSLSPGTTTLPDWFKPASYPQVFLERHGFLPDLSALDLLFCCGNRSGMILEASLSAPAF